MPWQKVWPTEVITQLKQLGLSDAKIATLKNYGSIQEAQRDPFDALRNIDRARLIAILQGAGFG